MTSHQGWSDISIWYKQNDSFMVGGDVGYRTTFDAFSFHQLYIRPTIRYRINPIFSVAFAVSTFHTLLDDAIDLNELRLAQQASIRWPKLGPLKFSQRIRLEERFYLIESTQANLQRVRYRLKMAPPEFFLFKKTRPFYSAITWETFVNIGSNFERYLGNSHRYELSLIHI